MCVEMTMNEAQLLEFVENLTPATGRGQVTHLLTDDETTVPLPEGVCGWLDEHPEGSDRGGYVPWLFLPDGTGIYYYEPDGEWH